MKQHINRKIKVKGDNKDIATGSYLQVFFAKIGVIFTFNNLLKIITIFSVGLFSRHIINEF
jgi:hypothetical protein